MIDQWTDGADVSSPRTATPVPPVTEAGRRPWRAVKRVTDILGAVLMLGSLAPLLALVALAIRIDSRGPVIFRQRRLGRTGQTFVLLKFRTMAAGASPDLHRAYIDALAAGEKAGDGLYKLTADPRVTRLGALLRRTSLDELPQLVNVLRGEMSIVGPRPALEYELVHYAPEHFERFAVRPGLTGLWQVSGRSALDFHAMLDLDVRYARATGALADVRILARTPAALLGGRAA